MTLQLNDFQRLMIFWNRIHPYQALDVVRVRRPIDVAGLQRAAVEELAATGIAGPVLDETTGICSFTSEQYPVEAIVVQPNVGESVQECLERHVSAELNRPFRINHDALVRLWVVPDGVDHWVGMTWQHWFCDGLTAGDWMRRILARWLDLPTDGTTSISERHGPTSKTAFPVAYRLRQRVASALEIVRAVSLSRRMYVPERSDSDFRVAVRMLPWPADVLARLQALGKPVGATVNDVLVATLLTALDRTLLRGGRQRLSVGNAVNLRPQGGDLLADKMGLYLALMIVHGPTRSPGNFTAWLEHVQTQTQRSKRQSTYWAGLGGMRLTRSLLPWLPEAARIRAAMNVVRLTGGMSNLRYPKDWYGPAWDDAVGEYWRGIPLGLSTPIALGVTTKNDRLTASVTWHPAALSEQQVAAILHEMTEILAK